MSLGDRPMSLAWAATMNKHEDRGHGQQRQPEGARDLTNHVALKDSQFRRPPCKRPCPGSTFRERQR